MKILIDLQSCQSGSRLGGIGRYSLNLTKSILNNNTQHEIFILLNGLFKDTILSVRESLNGLIKDENILIFDAIGPVSAMHEDTEINRNVSEIIREYFICLVNPDILLITSLIEGLGDDVIISVSDIFPKEKTYVVLYDLIPLVEKERYLTTDISKKHYFEKINYLKNSARLLSISQYSKKEAEKLLNIEAKKIVNISSAVDSKFEKIDISKSKKQAIYNKLNILDKFILYTGSFDQRKNHEKLIEAFSLLPSKISSSLQIVIVGNGWPEIYAHLHWIASNFNIEKEKIIFAGKINDSELLQLYNLASLFVFPSLREGFGLPVLEAMQCETVVIGSNRTSIPEVIGYEDALFNPTNAIEIADKIALALTNENFREGVLNNNIKQVEKFSWDISAKRALESFVEIKTNKNKLLFEDLMIKLSEIFLNYNVSDNYVLKVSNIILKNILTVRSNLNNNKIAMITTWNSRCGIAEYSKHIIGDNIDNYHVYAPKSEQLEYEDSCSVTRCWNFEDDLIYLKNQLISDGINKILIQFNYGFFNFKYFSNFIVELKKMNFIVYITMHSTTDPDLESFPNKKLSVIQEALLLCDRIFIHSKKDIIRLKSHKLINNVTLFPQGVVTKEINKISLGIDRSSFVIATYGFLLPHKGYLELIESFKILLDNHINTHLVMVNALYNCLESKILLSEITSLISKYKISDKVTLITNFLEDEKSIGYLKNADIIIYPFLNTNESSSASVRMGLNSDALVVTTSLAIFNDVNDVTYTLEENNFKDIAMELTKLQSQIKGNDINIEKIKNNALSWKKSHSYQVLSKKLLEIIG